MENSSTDSGRVDSRGQSEEAGRYSDTGTESQEKISEFGIGWKERGKIRY